MKSFKDYLSEETMPQALADKEFVGVESEAVRDNINNLIKGVTAKPFVTPYIALERVRKVLAYFHISLPAHNFMQGDYGYSIFNINQFGAKFGQTNDGDVVVKEDSPYSVYFEYQAGDDGLYDIFCELVTDDELEEILADYDDESEDNEENEEEYGANAQQNYEKNKDEHEGLKEETVNEIANTPRGKEAVRLAVHRADATVVDSAINPPRSKKGKREAKNAMKTIDRGINIHKKKGGVLDSYLKRAYGLKKEETEQIDEVSKKTLASYIKAASHDVATKSAATGRYADRANKARDKMKKGDYSDWQQGKKDDEFADKMFKKSWNRRKGIAKAADKLATEEKAPFDNPTEKPSTPYKNPKSKAKQLARAAMEQIKKGKEEKKRLRKSLREK